MRRRRKKRFNSYKFERLVKRKVHRLRSSVDATFFKVSSRRQDFSWRGGSRNPHIRRCKKTDVRHTLKLAIIIICFATTFWLILYHRTFKITEINVSGLIRIDESELLETVHATMGGNKLIAIPRSNYFFYNIKELQSVITSKYPIERSVIEKKFPSTLSIVVEEKITNLIYDNGKQYGYVDLEGNVVEILRNVSDNDWVEQTETVTSTDAEGNEIQETKVISRTHKPNTNNVQTDLGLYPILYDTRAKELMLNEQTLEPDTVQAVVAWHNNISKQSDIPIAYFQVGDAPGEITIFTKEGWSIKGKTENVEAQITELLLVLQSKIERPNLQYIDVRFLGRVYWK